MRHFKDMLRKADNNYVRDFKLSRDVVTGLGDAVAAALEQMRRRLGGEIGREADYDAIESGFGKPGEGGAGKKRKAGA